MEGNTAALRSSATQWSLAEDKQLLDILNNIHQSLVTRCQEVNKKLDEMVSALDGASVDLQNVNNKFMALSNSQFIESRVYDDDVDLVTQETPKEPPKPATTGEDITKLKRSVATLVAAHETIEILASDSDDDDDDDDARMVLKPKDMYAHRPLPYIIGSQAWRNKWHAGLHPEDSDSDSCVSKREEEYSDSEPEMSGQPQAVQHEREESTASSELPSEQDIVPVPQAGTKPTAADIAAELARRLGGQSVQIPIQEPEYSPPNPASKKVYRPEQPVSGAIFSDEPPPLDVYQSDSSDSPEDDIFAELHKSLPYDHSNKEQSRLADDLFKGLKDDDADVFSDFRESQTSSTKQKTTLFEDESEPEMFEQPPKPAPKSEVVKSAIDNVKKPIGGISLFGNTKGAESIGAVILRRNRQKSSSDEEEQKEIMKEPPKIQDTRATSKEKDIFDDLFAKSEREQKKKKIVEKPIKQAETSKPKVDLFSDNIFDDIDDIFTTNVIKTVKNDTNQKSIFDDDDVDIFSDIAVTETSNSKVDSKMVDKNKSIFDSDDDLFSDALKIEKKNTSKVMKKTELSNETKTLSKNEDDDIFTKSDIKNDNVIVNSDLGKEITDNKVLINHQNSANVNDNLNNIISNAAVNKIQTNNNSKSSAKSIFDDDDDENDDLFSSTATKSSISEQNTLTGSQTSKSKDTKSSLFGDDSDDNDLFGTKVPEPVKNNTKSINNNDSSSNEEVKEDINDKSIFDDIGTVDIIFANTPKQDSKIIASDQNKTQVSKPIKSKSLFDDDAEELFGESIKKPVQSKPKPELMKKPTIAPRNNISVAKEVHNKNTEQKQENIAQDVNNKFNNKEPEKELLISKEQLTDEQDKKNLTQAKIEPKLPSTETEITPLVEENTLTSSEEKLEPQPVIEEKSTNQSKVDSKQDKNIEFILPETENEMPTPLVTSDNDDDIFADEPNLQTTIEQTFHTPNVFDDIFSEPPAFEKSKEPKKSKNINALFDDDSDDEALFFKKNDPVLDEKPDLSPDISKDSLFGLFHDEPPAIDVDFIKKPCKSNIDDDFLKSDSDDGLFSTQRQRKDDLDSASKVPEVDSNIETKAIPIPKEETVKVEKPVISPNKPQIDKPKPIKESQKDITDEPKKVGKLKTMNFSIDVNTLLPGASPKKKTENLNTKSSEDLHEKEDKKAIEQTDGQIFAKSSEDLHSKEKIVPVMVKSVSFEGEPDSQVLDNKISKERAKIQVKRRPSTRRARKEAVRKSAIDFGDDSTDNSSSIDDAPRKPNVEHIQNTIDGSKDKDVDQEINIPKTDDFEGVILNSEPDILKTDQIQTQTDTSEQNQVTISNDETDSKPNVEEITDILESNIPESDDIFENIIYDPEKPTINLEPKIKDINPKSMDETKPEMKLGSPRSVTSKIVYILNDEDIFSTPPEITDVKSKTINIDNDDDLFKSKGNTSKTSEVVPNVSTLGNAYKDSTHIKNDDKKDNTTKDTKLKKSLFDDLSDDENELFSTNKKATSKPKSILDSDSEEDLFGGKKKETKDTKPMVVKEREIKKVEVKSSLFGDEDDDDDLFGPKKSNPASSSQPTRSTREATKPAQPVFDDPLSMLGGDED